VGALVLSGFGLAQLALPASDRSGPFAMNLAAVLLAAAYGGLPAGIGATLISAIAGYFGLFEGSASARAFGGSATIAFILEGVTISWLTARLARARSRAAEAAVKARVASEQFEVIVHGIQDGVTLQDSTGKLVYANQGAARIVGFPTGQALIDAPIGDVLRRFELYDASGAPLPLERLPNRTLFQGGTPHELLVQYDVKGDPERHWSVVNASGVFAEDGRLRYVVNLFRDVTERQRQQEELRVSREWFSTALRSIGDAVIATDASGAVTFLNPIAEELTGWSLAEATGQPLSAVFAIQNEHTREPLPSPVERVVATGSTVGLVQQTLLTRRDGQGLAIDDSAAPIRAKDGTLAGVVLVFRDVTRERFAAERREFLGRATLELNSSLDYRATLATVARLAVPRMADWCAVDVVEDGELRRLAVAHVDAAKVAWVEELQRRYPPDPSSDRGVANILRTGQAEMIAEIPAAMIEAVARDADHLRLLRELRLHSYIGVPMTGAAGAFGAITLVTAESNRVYTSEDLDFARALADRAALAVEHARLYRSAERAKLEAERANRTKDDFLAMLGHELRNPLAPIVTAVDLMRQRPDADHSRERQMIERQVKHMVRLVDDLLDVSRIVHGRVTLARERVELDDVVREALELSAPLLRERHHHLDVRVAPRLAVLADPVRLIQVLTNLLDNAAKYTEPGGHLAIELGRDGAEVVLRITDDGIGIAPAMLPRIFDLFVQAPQTIDRSRGGLGLGLTIVQSLVRSFGGRVSAESAGEGRGSSFVVRLPLLEAAAAEPPSPAPGRAPNVRALSILVVDDNVDALEMLSEALRLLGHEVHAAADAGTALALAARVQPGLALLDIGLPQMDGYELGRRLRASPGLEQLPLVALTGYGQATDRERSQAEGFVAHLVKPVGLDAIRRLIEEIAEGASRDGAAAAP
jgi:PAS domain S-box-containing protein